MGIGLLLAAVASACTSSTGALQDPSPVASPPEASTDPVRNEINRLIMQPLADAFLRGDADLLPLLAESMNEQQRSRIRNAVDRAPRSSRSSSLL